MSKPDFNDISIGKDQHITFIDVAGRQDRAVSIDHLIAPLASFWTALETNCVAECCGIDAFSFWPEDIRRAAATGDSTSVSEGLASLHEFIRQNGADIFVSRRLNNYLDRQVLLQLIEHIQAMAREQSSSR
jgi:hypothetical protein